MKRSLLVALMFGTLIGYANERTNSNEFVGKKTVKVEFKNVKKGQTLTIKSKDGVIVYNRAIESNGTFSKMFDLSALENGYYTAELEKDYEIIVKDFKVKNGLVSLLQEESKKVFKPVIRAEGDILYISKIAFNKKPLEVSIYYKDEIILSETVKGENILKRIYKLSESEKGNYKVVVSADQRMYIKDFTL